MIFARLKYSFLAIKYSLSMMDSYHRHLCKLLTKVTSFRYVFEILVAHQKIQTVKYFSVTERKWHDMRMSKIRYFLSSSWGSPFISFPNAKCLVYFHHRHVFSANSKFALHCKKNTPLIDVHYGLWYREFNARM